MDFHGSSPSDLMQIQGASAFLRASLKGFPCSCSFPRIAGEAALAPDSSSGPKLTSAKGPGRQLTSESGLVIVPFLLPVKPF